VGGGHFCRVRLHTAKWSHDKPSQATRRFLGTNERHGGSVAPFGFANGGGAEIGAAQFTLFVFVNGGEANNGAAQFSFGGTSWGGRVQVWSSRGDQGGIRVMDSWLTSLAGKGGYI
jgi:hypothetical protein